MFTTNLPWHTPCHQQTVWAVRSPSSAATTLDPLLIFHVFLLLDWFAKVSDCQIYVQSYLCMAIIGSPPYPANCTDFDLRLDPANGGKLLVCFNQAWGAICNGLSSQTASIACHQLGYQKYGKSIMTGGRKGKGEGGGRMGWKEEKEVGVVKGRGRAG